MGKHSNGFSLSVLQKLKANEQCENHVRLVHSSRVWLAIVESARRAISEKATTKQKRKEPNPLIPQIYETKSLFILCCSILHPATILSCLCVREAPPAPAPPSPLSQPTKYEGRRGRGRDFYPRDKNWKRDLKCHHGIPRKGEGFDKI